MNLRLLHLLFNLYIDDGEVVSLMHWPPFTPRNIAGVHFCYRLSRLLSHSVAGRIRPTQLSDDLIGNQTHDSLACT
jgi:hypothetical protein